MRAGDHASGCDSGSASTFAVRRLRSSGKSLGAGRRPQRNRLCSDPAERCRQLLIEVLASRDDFAS
jgi:hypothetical protein